MVTVKELLEKFNVDLELKDGLLKLEFPENYTKHYTEEEEVEYLPEDKEDLPNNYVYSNEVAHIFEADTKRICIATFNPYYVLSYTNKETGGGEGFTVDGVPNAVIN